MASVPNKFKCGLQTGQGKSGWCSHVICAVGEDASGFKSEQFPNLL